MGGKIAQALAARRPAGLVGVVLVAPAPAGPVGSTEVLQQLTMHAYDDEHRRHRSGVVLDAIIAEPVIARLVAEEAPRGLGDEITGLIRDWLQTHVISGTTQGHPIRVRLRQRILRQCSLDAAVGSHRV